MKALIIYDSDYGNTEQLAKKLSASKTENDDIKAAKVDDVYFPDLESLDLLVVGSPTQGGRPTQRIRQFLDMIPSHSLDNIKVASFDTRLEPKEQNPGLRLVMKVIGFAAPKIEKILEAKGGQAAAAPSGFIVKDTEGPLKDGELEKAVQWMRGFAI